MIPLDGLLVNTEATPFVGLRSFTSDDAGIYFGREDEVREMISRLERGRFLAILGDSGVGKSSLVAAGLLPELTRGALTGRHSGWTMIRFQPGLDPILSLAEAVTASARQRRVGDDLNRTLRLSSLALAHLLADSARTSSTNILLFADQFEEIFAYQDDKHTPEARMEASLYVRLLLEACQFPDAPIYLLLTMRSEYLGRTIEFAALPEALNEGQYLVPQLREGLREAIVGPAAVRGASVSPGLVQVLLNEASKPGNLLPVLQHALMRTWVQARSRVETSGEPTFELRLEDYAGGVASSLQEHASDVIAALPPQNRELVRLVFQAITLKDLSGHIRRRPVSFDGLCRLVNASVGDLQPVLEAFSAPDCAMLTIRPTGPLTSTSTVDLTHESLIWKWPALARWIDEEARDASLFRDALEDARRYRNGEDSRWRGVRLAEGVAWQGQPHHSEEWATRYVRDATTLAEVRRFIAESKRREDRENTRARRQVWLLLLGCGALLVALLIFLKLANERKAANAKLRGLNDELALGKGNLAAAVEDLTKKEGALNEALRTLRSSRQALVDETKALGQAKRDLQDQNSQLRQQDKILKETDTARGVLLARLTLSNEELERSHKELEQANSNLTRQNDDLDEARKKNEENYKRAASAIASLFQTRAKEAYRRSQPIVALDYGRAALANAVVAGEMPIGLAEILTDSLGASRVVTRVDFPERIRNFTVTEVRDDPRKPVRSAVVAIGTSGALFEAPLPCPDPENLSFELRSDLEPAVLLRQGIGSHVHPRRIPKALQTQLADAMRTDGRPASKGVALDSDGGVLLGFEDGTAKWIRYWASSDALQAALSDQRTLVRMMEKRRPGISIGLESTPADTSPITSVGELDPLYDISGVYKWRLPSRAVFQLFSLPSDGTILSVHADGSWAQYVLRDVNGKGKILEQRHSIGSGAASPVLAADLRKDGSMLAILGERGLSVWSFGDVWSLGEWKEIPAPRFPERFQASTLAIHPSRRWIAIAERSDGGTNEIKLADLDLRTLEDNWAFSRRSTTALGWSPDGNYLAGGDQDGNVTVYRINPVSKKYHDIDLSIRGHSRAIRRVVWTGPENLITFDDDSIILWDLSRRTIVAKAESKKHLLLTDAAAQREVLPLLADAVRQLVEASPTCPVVSASSITGR